MKKKITAIVLCVAMLAIAIVGSTMAYFTDVDQNTNAYGVAGLDISLSEQVNHVDGAGNSKPMLSGNSEVTGLQTNVTGIEYQHIMPGDVMNKTVTVTNEEDYPAYVALAIKQEGWKNFNSNIDDYFEAIGTDMQTVTDNIFTGSGWNGLSYDKYTNGYEIRYYPKNVAPVDQDGSESYVGNSATEALLIAVDYTVQQGAANIGYAAGYKDNMFGEQFVDTSGLTLSRCVNGEVYGSLNANDRLWVYYLYLPAHKSYTLDLTITCPTYINNTNIAAFEAMVIDVQATAIQVDGFATAKEAFTELNKTYNFSF